MKKDSFQPPKAANHTYCSLSFSFKKALTKRIGTPKKAQKGQFPTPKTAFITICPYPHDLNQSLKDRTKEGLKKDSFQPLRDPKLDQLKALPEHCASNTPAAKRRELSPQAGLLYGVPIFLFLVF